MNSKNENILGIIRDVSVIILMIAGCVIFLSNISFDSDAASSYDLTPVIYEDKDETFPMEDKVGSPLIGLIPYKVALSSEGNVETIGDSKHMTMSTDGIVRLHVERTNTERTNINGSVWNVFDNPYGELKGETVGPDLKTGRIGEGRMVLLASTSSGWEIVGNVIMAGTENIIEIPSDYINRGTEFRLLVFSTYEHPAAWTERYWTDADIAWSILGGWIAALIIGEGSGVRDVSDFTHTTFEYSFKLTTNNADTLRLINLTESDDADVDMSFVTLGDGSITTTGFRIDRSLNPYLDVKILRNGETYRPFPLFWILPVDTITEEGRYTITTTSSSGASVTKDIWIIRNTHKTDYLGQCPVSFDERVYSEGEYPTYFGEVRLTHNILPEIAKFDRAPTLSVKVFRDNVEVFSDSFVESGDYRVIYQLGRSDDGDSVVWTYRFNIVSEPPGPVINHRNLISNYFQLPVAAWSFTIPTAGPANATLLFESKDAAMDALFEFELGRVQYVDGVIYWSPSDEIGMRIEPVDLEQVIRQYVESKVIYHTIDLSKVITVDLDGEDIRAAKIFYDVYVRGNGQFETSDSIPIIGGTHMVLTDNGTGIYDVIEDVQPFCLIDVGDGIDSHHAEARSSDGRVLILTYGVPVEEQLADAGMYGTLTITETTVYGRSVEYHVHMASVDDIAGIVSFIDGSIVQIEDGIAISGDLPILSVESSIPWMVWVWRQYYIQDATSVYGEDIPIRPGTSMVEICSVSGMKVTLIIDSHSLDATANWEDRSMGLHCDLCSQTYTVEDADVVAHIIHSPICTNPGGIKEVMSADVRGKHFERDRIISIPELGHDYVIDYVWAEDGSSCAVSFSCWNDPVAHSGSFVISKDDINSKRLGNKIVYSVSGTMENIRVNSSHTVYDDEWPQAPMSGYAAVVVSALVALAGVAMIIRRFRS